VMTS